ncbi:MAG: T9SS C-terminal target domain-containing protein, partial [Bacteroidetes bacterium]
AFDPVTYTGGEVCLNGADRAGEFCQILPVGGGQYLGVTPAMHNHELLLYQSVPGDVRNWASMAVDSTARLFNDINFRHFFESFGFVDASLGPDRVLHLVYAVSVSYGNGPITGSFYNNRQPLIYTQVALDSLGDTSYTPHHFTFPVRNRIRSQCGITTVGNDTIFLAYATPSVQEVAVARSIDGGASWEQDTLYKRSVNAPLQVAVVDDSVLVLAYDADRDYLIASRQALTGGDWVHRLVTQTEVRGVHLSSVIARTGNDDKIQIAYTESAEDRVYLATRQAGTWTHEAVSKPGKGVGTVSMVTLAGEPIIAYDQLGDSLLVVAYQDNGAWTEEVIRASVAVGDVKLAANPTDIHLCYYDLTEGGLSYAHRLVGAGAWSHEVVDTSSLIIGQAPDAALDVAGTLHVVYLDVLNAKLRYAQRSPAGAWTLEDVTEAQNYLPAFPSLRLGSNGQPRVAFRNSATNRILFAERDQAGDWSIQTVDSDPSNLLGAPLRLLLDASDRPWVLYNHVTAVNGMRVARRADNGQWTAVSVTNNTAEIGNQFSFHVVEEDLYIIGRKNRLDNNGLGLLYAERGIKTWLEPQMVEASFRMGPNPAQAGHPLRLSFDLPQAREVTIGIYNLQGQCVHLWESEGTLSPGFHRWDAQPEGLAPGLYLVQLRTAQYQVSRRWVVQP